MAARFFELVDARESSYKKRGMSAGNFMKAIQSYHLIKPEDLLWRPSNLTRSSKTGRRLIAIKCNRAFAINSGSYAGAGRPLS